MPLPQGAAELVPASRHGSTGTAVRAGRVGWVRGWWPFMPLFFLSTCSLAGPSSQPELRGAQEMAVDWLYNYVFSRNKMLLI